MTAMAKSCTCSTEPKSRPRGFGDDMKRFFGGRKKTIPETSDKEKARLIEEYIRTIGVTRCPDGWAMGLDDL